MVPGTQAAAFQTRSLPQTRRGPTAPAGWAPSLGTAVDHQVRGGHDPPHRPLREAEGYGVPRRSWGCQRRQTLDRAPPWAAGHPSRPRSWRCSPPPQGNHTKGVPFKREDVHGLKGLSQVSTCTCEPLMLNFDLHKQLGFFFHIPESKQKISCSSLLNFYGCKKWLFIDFPCK